MVSSFESAGIGGLAHLATGAKGTDTVTSLVYASKYYDWDWSLDMPAFSIPAGEHSVYTAWQSDEAGYIGNMIDQFGKPGALFALPPDAYDYFNALDQIICGVHKQKIIDSGALMVCRGDSGDPVEVLAATMVRLEEAFGCTTNTKGYKVLNHMRVLWGDGINLNSIEQILESFTAAGYSTENIAFGMGGALLQGITRDTQRFAMKASAILRHGEWHGISKNPVTDPGKRSKEGLLFLAEHEGKFVTRHQLNETRYRSAVWHDDWHDDEAASRDWVLDFEDGYVANTYTLSEIRSRVQKYL